MDIINILKQLNAQGIQAYVEDGKLKTRSDSPIIAPELIQLIRDNKDSLIFALSQGLTESHRAIPKVERTRQHLPVSYGQRRLWFIDQFEHGSAQYNMPVVYPMVDTGFSKAAFELALNAIVTRHEVLRSSYIEEHGEVFQRVNESPFVPINYIDLSCLDSELQKAEVARLAKLDALTPFDLNEKVMLRATLLTLSHERCVILFNIHHIASDGWSMGILKQEFEQFYHAFKGQGECSLPPLNIQYADYASWQRKQLQGALLERQLQFWNEKLHAIPQLHSLPLDWSRPEKQQYQGKQYHHQLSTALHREITVFCERNNVTLFMFLKTTFALLIGRYGRDEDVVIGSPIAGRTHKDLAPLMGFFINTLVFRTRLDADLTFSQLLQEERTKILAVFEHQDIPFDYLVDELQPERSLSHSPLFQILFVLQNNEVDLLDSPQLEGLEEDVGFVKFDLELAARELPDGLKLSWNFNLSLFTEMTVKALAQSFERLIVAVLANPEQHLYRLPLVTEQQQEPFEVTDAEASDSKSLLLHQLFEQHALLHGDKIAVAAEDNQVSYGQLNRRANQLAHFLVEQGVRPDELVGICLDRSVEMIVSILAILKAGAAYVPLDPSYPAARILDIIYRAEPTHLLVQTNTESVFDACSSKLIILDESDLQATLASKSEANPEPCDLGLTSDNLACVIFTSGSTGIPKGVMVEHKNIVRLVSDLAYFSCEMPPVTMQASSIAFDAATFEIWAPLSWGGKVVLMPPGRLDISQINTRIRKHKVNTLWLTSALFDVWVESDGATNSGLKTVISGGDIVSRKSVERLYQKNPNVTFVNGYGPTETTTFATSHIVSRDELKLPLRSIPIGKPIAQTQCYVVDSLGQFVPQGAIGELLIGGLGVTRGYLKQAELTEQHFIELPDLPGKTLYKTGDLVRQMATGAIEFIGRADKQIKIRGFRIEPAEIEAKLLSLKDVMQVAVVAKDIERTGKCLVAYVVLSETVSDASAWTATARSELRQQLPEYLLPQAIVILQALPVTRNGKLDRDLLPDPEEHAFEFNQYVAPRNRIEDILCQIWCGLLGIEKVGINDNFFAIGGHSLLATRLVSEIRDKLSVEVALKDVFSLPTIGRLSKVLSTPSSNFTISEITPLLAKENLPLSFAQQRLWFIDKLGGGSIQYNMPSIYTLVEENFDFTVFQSTLNHLLIRHEAIRTNFVEHDGEVCQVIRDIKQFPVEIADLSGSDAATRDEALRQLSRADALKQFDLSQDLMLRVTLVILSANEYRILFNMHHIASDGWSLGVLQREFSLVYNAFRRNEASPLATLTIQYSDYASWQRRWLQGETLQQQLSFWQRYLQDIPEVHGFPLDIPRPAKLGISGKHYREFISGSPLQAIRKVCDEHNVTLFMFLQTAFAVLLGRYSGESTIVMGAPVAGRVHKNVESLIGFFVNTLVLKTELVETDSFEVLLKKNKQNTLSAYEFQHIPFDLLVDELKPERSLSYSPLFQILFVLQNNESYGNGTGFQAGFSDTVELAKFDLELSVTEEDERLCLSWLFNTGLFFDTTIARLSANFIVLLEQICLDITSPITALTLMSDKDTKWILKQGEGIKMPFPTGGVHELFESQAELCAQDVAITYAQDSISYQILNNKANKLARYLVELGVGQDVAVALCIERSLEMVIATLAVLKAGGAYAPIDSNFSDEVISKRIEAVSPLCVLASAETSKRLQIRQKIVNLHCETVQQLITLQPSCNLGLSVPSKSLAYILSTSGTTGKPKLIGMPHEPLTNLLWSIREDCQRLQYAQSVLQYSSFSFDMSFTEIFFALSYGGKLNLIDETQKTDFVALAEIIRSNEITLLNFPYSVLHTFASFALDQNLRFESLEVIISTAEQLIITPEIKAFFKQHSQLRLVNHYGPSETHVCTSMTMPLDPDDWEDIPSIGKPIVNNKIYVLDKQMKPVPIGAVGELYVGGTGVARGYLNLPELSNEKFISNPFTGHDAEHMYRTGDIVRWLDNGELEYLGRNDLQVKIRGFRIELAEVEIALNSLPEIKRTAVIAWPLVTQATHLIAYLVVDSNVVISTDFESMIVSKLSELIPNYMIPSEFVFIDDLPINNNGKLDKNKLPAPRLINGNPQEVVFPSGDLEHELAIIWADLLKLSIEKVGVTHTFFQLGGHSLLIVRLASKINARWGVDIEVKLFFENNTIRSLASYISGDLKIKSSLMSDKQIDSEELWII